jgi:hypothetical protein
MVKLIDKKKIVDALNYGLLPDVGDFAVDVYDDIVRRNIPNNQHMLPIARGVIGKLTFPCAILSNIIAEAIVLFYESKYKSLLEKYKDCEDSEAESMVEIVNLIENYLIHENTDVVITKKSITED